MTPWLFALAWAGPPVVDRDPSDATVVYYNARMALREGQAQEAVKLWLLRNAVQQTTGELSPFDGDFRTIVWAALGDAGMCQDGLKPDEEGAGLWPLALHNWVVRNLSHRTPAKRPPVYQALDLGRQDRFVSVSDVLNREELRTVHFYRGRCLRAQWELLSSGETVATDLSDRQTAARLLRWLLELARGSVVAERVRGRSAIEARLFDVDLEIVALAAQEAKKKARERARKGRSIGMSREAVTSMTASAPSTTLAEEMEAARILRECPTWPAEDWVALSSDRRRFLFDKARSAAEDDAPFDPLALAILDALVADGDAAESGEWIGRYHGDPEAIWAGDRGARLLALDAESGFRERAVIALHRGVRALELGDLPNALRSLAYALQYAPESAASDAIQGLARRWVSYLAAQFSITDDLLVTLQELVPRRDFTLVLEDLMWRAAFHADKASFERGVRNQLGGDALERRLALLQPLADGDVARFGTGVRTGLAKAPSETMRFLDQLAQRLELEDGDVRAAQVPTLVAVRKLVEPLSTEAGKTDGTARTASALLVRTRAILDGVGEAGDSARERARGLAPGTEVYAGSVRLAPTDPLPWPFQSSEAAAPSIFTPIRLTPEEWRDEAGDWVLGWSLGG